MKKLGLLLLILTIVGMSVSPAMAAPGDGNGGQPANFVLSGTISAIGVDTVTVWVVGGNYPVHPYRSQTLTVTVTPYTTYLYQLGTYAVPTSFSALAVGQPVSVYGSYQGGVWIASRITIGARLLCCLP